MRGPFWSRCLVYHYCSHLGALKSDYVRRRLERKLDRENVKQKSHNANRYRTQRKG